MASSRKSLSDFFGLSWANWSEYTGEFTHSDEEDKNEGRRKSSDTMRLYSSDMQKFGLFPDTDCFCTVVCSECSALVKPQGLLNHMRLRHKDLVSEKVSPEKLNKLVDNSSIKHFGERATVKHVLNEKLLTKLIMNEKHSNKLSIDKIPSSPSDKHKSSEKPSGKYCSNEKTLLKSGDKFLGKSSGDKASRTLNDKVKVPLEKSQADALLLIDKPSVKSETDKFSKPLSDSYLKQADATSKKLSEKLPPKSTSENLYSSPENKVFALGDRHLSRSGEKISVKSVLSEKLLSKVAASEKATSLHEKLKCVDPIKIEGSFKRGDSLLRTDRTIAKPVMKSLLKRSNDATQSIVPGTSLLRPLVHQDRDLSSAVTSIGATTLSPPVLTPQNVIPDLQQSATDMPVLSRKRKYRERKAAPTQYNPDRHCGVWCDYFNKFCVRSLTCKVHSVALRRAVVGRSKPFDQLLIEHKRAKDSQSREDQDDISDLSPQMSDRLHSPSEPSNSSFVSSSCASPASSQTPSPSENFFLTSTTDQDEAISLFTSSTFTSPPVPLPSYQYHPHPPPDSTFNPAPDSMVALSPHLSSPLLNVALPSLSPSHAPRPPDSTEEDSSKYPRNIARAVNRLQLNKGKQFNVKHSAFPPKPLRTCLFQGRKSSGMFFVQRELESMRTGFRLSLIKGTKSMPLSHAPIASQSLSDAATSHSSISSFSDPILQNPGINTPSSVSASSSLKSVLNTLCSPKTVTNRDGQQRVQRNQKSSNGSDLSLPQAVSSEAALKISNEKLPQGMRISVPTTLPQQIAYLTTSTPVTFQQVPLINSQVLSQLQLQSKGSGGTLKLLSTGGGGRTLYVHQYQDGSGAES